MGSGPNYPPPPPPPPPPVPCPSCPAGQMVYEHVYLNDPGVCCQACTAGTYNPSVGGTCACCPAGQYQDGSYGTGCKAVSAGNINLFFFLIE